MVVVALADLKFGVYDSFPGRKTKTKHKEHQARSLLNVGGSYWR